MNIAGSLKSIAESHRLDLMSGFTFEVVMIIGMLFVSSPVNIAQYTQHYYYIPVLLAAIILKCMSFIYEHNSMQILGFLSVVHGRLARGKQITDTTDGPVKHPWHQQQANNIQNTSRDDRYSSTNVLIKTLYFRSVVKIVCYCMQPSITTFAAWGGPLFDALCVLVMTDLQLYSTANRIEKIYAGMRVDQGQDIQFINRENGNLTTTRTVTRLNTRPSDYDSFLTTEEFVNTYGFPPIFARSVRFFGGKWKLPPHENLAHDGRIRQPITSNDPNKNTLWTQCLGFLLTEGCTTADLGPYQDLNSTINGEAVTTLFEHDGQIMRIQLLDVCTAIMCFTFASMIDYAMVYWLPVYITVPCTYLLVWFVSDTIENTNLLNAPLYSDFQGRLVTRQEFEQEMHAHPHHDQPSYKLMLCKKDFFPDRSHKGLLYNNRGKFYTHKSQLELHGNFYRVTISMLLIGIFLGCVATASVPSDSDRHYQVASTLKGYCRDVSKTVKTTEMSPPETSWYAFMTTAFEQLWGDASESEQPFRDVCHFLMGSTPHQIVKSDLFWDKIGKEIRQCEQNNEAGDTSTLTRQKMMVQRNEMCSVLRQNRIKNIDDMGAETVKRDVELSLSRGWLGSCLRLLVVYVMYIWLKVYDEKNNTTMGVQWLCFIVGMYCTAQKAFSSKRMFDVGPFYWGMTIYLVQAELVTTMQEQQRLNATSSMQLLAYTLTTLDWCRRMLISTALIIFRVEGKSIDLFVQILKHTMTAVATCHAASTHMYSVAALNENRPVSSKYVDLLLIVFIVCRELVSTVINKPIFPGLDCFACNVLIALGLLAFVTQWRVYMLDMSTAASPRLPRLSFPQPSFDFDLNVIFASFCSAKWWCAAVLKECSYWEIVYTFAADLTVNFVGSVNLFKTYVQYTGPLLDLPLWMCAYYKYKHDLGLTDTHKLKLYITSIWVMFFVTQAQSLVMHNQSEYGNGPMQNGLAFTQGQERHNENPGAGWNAQFNSDNKLVTNVVLLPMWTMITKRLWVYIMVKGTALHCKHS
jgi:hypothetical protein